MTRVFLESVWTSLPVPCVVFDENNLIRDINPAAEGFFNASKKSLEGDYLWHRLIVEPSLQESFSNSRHNAAQLFVNDVRVEAGARSAVQCNLKLAPLVAQSGYMILLIAPHELAGRLTQTQSVKSAAKSAIGMAEMLAHEIKNPLAGITGAAQLLSMSLTSKDLELTDLIVAETRRIVKLLEQVEQFGNLRAPRLQEVNIHDALDRARRSAQLGFGAHMQFFEDYDPSLPAVYGDADQLLQVFLNLLKNASEAATKKGGTIRLRTFYEHSFKLRHSDGAGQALPLQIEICDDGPGLPSDIRNNIFDPFVSGKENGTGLGLSLTSKIISDHCGWVCVESKPGSTIFRISLPRVPQENRVKDK